MDVNARQKGSMTNPKKRFPTCLTIMLLAALGLWSGCHQQPLPAELVGAWTTADTRFEGRVLTITPKTVEITVHGESVAFYSIDHVSVAFEARLSRVMLSLQDMQLSPSRMTLNYDPQRDTLWLENRPDTVWHRRAG